MMTRQMIMTLCACLLWSCGGDTQTVSPTLISSSTGGDSGGGVVDDAQSDGGALTDGSWSDSGAEEAWTFDAVEDGTSTADSTAPADGGASPGPDSGDLLDGAMAVDASVDAGRPVDVGPGPADVEDAATSADIVDVSSAGDTAQAADTSTPPDAGVDAGPTPVCGDLKCDDAEKGGCPFDCAKSATSLWSCAPSKCGAQLKACQGADACVSAIGTALTCADKCNTLDQACVLQCQKLVANQPEAGILMSCVLTSGCVIASGPYCGDGTCNGSESPATCFADCKPVCGDGKCELPENALSCPKDCAPPPPVCGDGKCEPPENALSCPKDCAPPPPPCGDGVCAANENASSCALDCDPNISKFYGCVKTKCPTQTAACIADKSCAAVAVKTVQCIYNCSGKPPTCIVSCSNAALANPTAYALINCGLGCF